MASDQYTPGDIEAFVGEQVGEPVCALDPDLDLFQKFGIDGDDCVEFISQFGKAFDVNLSRYLWYFHHGEEPHAGFAFQIFWPAPNERVARIPISPRVLLSSANAGIWTIEYPPYSLPKLRYDVIAAWLFLTPLLGFGLLLFSR